MQQQTTIVKAGSPPKRSFLASLSSGINNLYNGLEKGFIRTQEEVNSAWANATDARFRKLFKLSPDERLIGEYWAQCLSGGRPTSCTCYVSSHNFCIVVDLPNGKANIVIPLTDIVSIQPAIALRGSGAPVIQPISDQRIRADAVQIFTRDLKLHQFFAFLHFDRAFSALVHSWQAMQTPPSQTYSAQSYAPTTQTYTPVTQVYTPNAQAYGTTTTQTYAPTTQTYASSTQTFAPTAQTYTPVYTTQPASTVTTVQLDKGLPTSNTVVYTPTTATTYNAEPYTTATTVPVTTYTTAASPPTTTYSTTVVEPAPLPGYSSTVIESVPVASSATTVICTQPQETITTTTTTTPMM